MKRILPIALMFLFIQAAAFPQGLRLGVEGGALIVTGPDEFKNSAPEGFGMKNGFSFGAKAKYDMPLSPFRFSGGINYSRFSAEEYYSSYAITKISHPFPPIGLEKSMSSAADVVPGDILSETSSSIISIGAGAEWQITDWKVSPYLTGGLFLNYYETEDKETDLYNSENNIEIKDSGTRIGGFLGAGAEIKLIDKLSLDVFAKYNLYDLMNTSEMEGLIGEANNGFSAIYAGASLMWKIF